MGGRGRQNLYLLHAEQHHGGCRMCGTKGGVSQKQAVFENSFVISVQMLQVRG